MDVTSPLSLDANFPLFVTTEKLEKFCLSVAMEKSSDDNDEGHVCKTVDKIWRTANKVDYYSCIINF